MSQKWGTVFIGGIQLDIDPDDYNIISGKRRGSVHQLITPSTINGTMTMIQDFGVDMGDFSVEIRGVAFDSTIAALLALYRLTNYSFIVTDFKYNNYTAQFEPGEESFKASTVAGSQDAWTYFIKLRIVVWNSTETVSGSTSTFPPI
jgi:hypothetical protein